MNNAAGNKNQIDVLLQLKNSIMQSVSVADVARITAITQEMNREIFTCQSICNTSLIYKAYGTNVIHEYYVNKTIGVGQLVVVLFTDYDYTIPFRFNLSNANSSDFSYTKFSTTDKLHSTKYGIIIDRL